MFGAECQDFVYLGILPGGLFFTAPSSTLVPCCNPIHTAKDS